MTVFLNNIKRIFRKKLNIVVLLIAPIILTSFVMTSSNEKSTLRIGIIDNDKTEFTELLTSNLKSKYEIIPIKKDEIQRKLINSTIEYAIVINKGFTDDIISGRDAVIESYNIKETNTSQPLKLYINNFISSSKNIASAAAGSSEKFYKGIDEYKNGSFTAEYKTFEVNTSTKNMTLNSLGLLVMCMLFLSSFATSIILEDKRSKTFYRMLAAPLTAASYRLQSILSFMAVSAIQIIVIFGFIKFVFKGDLGPSIINMFIIFFVFSVVCVSLGVAITSVSKDSGQAGAISTLVNVPITMLGGCYWPREIMPDMLKRISNFVPTTWALNGAEKVINGGSILDASTEIGIMLLFALVFFLLSSWKKTDIAD